MNKSFTYTEMKKPLSFSPKAFSFLLASFRRWPLAFFFFLLSFAVVSGIDKRRRYSSYESKTCNFKGYWNNKAALYGMSVFSPLHYLSLMISFCGSEEDHLFSWALQVQVLFLHVASPRARSGFLSSCLFEARPHQAQRFCLPSPLRPSFSSSCPLCSFPPEAPPCPTARSADTEKPRHS